MILPNAHLPSHSRMSGSRWVITPSWLSGSWRSFLYSSSVLGPYHFCPLSSPSLHEKNPLVSLIFLKRTLIVPILLFFSISLHWSLRKAFFSLLAILWKLYIQMYMSFIYSFAFHFFSQLFVRPPQTAILPFCISFSWGWSWSLSPLQCHEPLFIVH